MPTKLKKAERTESKKEGHESLVRLAQEKRQGVITGVISIFKDAGVRLDSDLIKRITEIVDNIYICHIDEDV